MLWGQLVKHNGQKTGVAHWFQMKRSHKPIHWLCILVISYYCVSSSLVTFIGPCLSIYENICNPQGMLKTLRDLWDGHKAAWMNHRAYGWALGGWLFIRNNTDGCVLGEDDSTQCCVCLICQWGAEGKALGLRLHYHPDILLKSQTLQLNKDSWAVTARFFH